MSMKHRTPSSECEHLYMVRRELARGPRYSS